MIESNDIPEGAGIIVVRDFGGILKVLALLNKGIYDIPKGGIDDKESALEAAIRETEEEAGITELNFMWGTNSYINEKMTFFIALTTQDPIIRPNPHTGILEHDSAKWVSWTELCNNTKKFIVPGVIWAHTIIGSGLLANK